MINPTLVLNEILAPPADGRVYGIHTATEGFVRAFLAHAKPGELRFRTDKDEIRAALRAEARRCGAEAREVASPDEVAPCAMYYTMPPAALFWLRHSGGAVRYAICGLHHSLTGRDVVGHLRDLALAPTEPWDALVCTSRAARDAIRRTFEGWSDYMASRGGTLPEPRLQLPVIPLGVDTAAFVPAGAGRAAPDGLRARLGIPEEALVALFLGRLNFSSKAHPLPMLLGLERARRELGRPVHLIQAGWFPSGAVGEATAALARDAAPSVVHHHVGSVSGPDRTAAYAAADLFVSLADNVQETFGLTVVEAMASGLPVVATDWDGYRDTVVPGATGFLIPTTMAPAGSGREIGLAHGAGGRPYNRYLMDAAQATSVDHDSFVRAVVALGRDPDLGARLGEAGRRRARLAFDWSAVIASYRELWDDLDRRRRATAGDALRPARSPMYPDPFEVFGAFASSQLGPDDRLRLRPDWEARFRSGLGSQTLRAPSDLLLDDAGLRGLLHASAGGPAAVAVLCPEGGDAGARTVRSLLWLMKVGALERVADGDG